MGLVYHLASGDSLFSGVALVLVAMALAVAARAAWLRLAVRLLTTLGVLLIVLSATPLPAWLYGVWFLAMLAWLAVERKRGRHITMALWALRAAVVGLAVAACVLEWPYRVAPRLSGPKLPRLVVVADSLAAGLSAGERTWPQILAATYGVDVLDLSQAGATVRSAKEQVANVPSGGAVVVLLIGGNDLLGKTTADQFEEGLRSLLARLRGPERRLVMFELPLPPFSNNFGRAQRRLAAEFGVVLAPKRILSALFADPAATRDGIHLSRAGHDAMADRVWELVGRALVARH